MPTSGSSSRPRSGAPARSAVDERVRDHLERQPHAERLGDVARAPRRCGARRRGGCRRGAGCWRVGHAEVQHQERRASAVRQRERRFRLSERALARARSSPRGDRERRAPLAVRRPSVIGAWTRAARSPVSAQPLRQLGRARARRGSRNASAVAKISTASKPCAAISTRWSRSEPLRRERGEWRCRTAWAAHDQFRAPALGSAESR